MKRLLFLVLCVGSFAVPVYAQTQRPGDVYALSSSPWVDDHGKQVPLSQWQGKHVFLSFFYTNCILICPRTISILQQVDEEFKKQGRKAEFILITLDVDIDKPQKLARFKKARGLGENWHLLVGTKKQTKRLGRQLGFHSYRMDDVHFMHDFHIYVVGPAGEVQRAVGWDDKPAEVVAGLLRTS